LTSVAVAAAAAVPTRRMKYCAASMLTFVTLMLHQAFGDKACSDYTKRFVANAKASSTLDDKWSPINAVVPQKDPNASLHMRSFWSSAKISSMGEYPQILKIYFRTGIYVASIAFESYDAKSSPSKFYIVGLNSQTRKRKALARIDERDSEINGGRRKFEFWRYGNKWEKYTEMHIIVYSTAKNANYVTIGRLEICFDK